MRTIHHWLVPLKRRFLLHVHEYDPLLPKQCYRLVKYAAQRLNLQRIHASVSKLPAWAVLSPFPLPFCFVFRFVTADFSESVVCALQHNQSQRSKNSRWEECCISVSVSELSLCQAGHRWWTERIGPLTAVKLPLSTFFLSLSAPSRNVSSYSAVSGTRTHSKEISSWFPVLII